MWNEPTEVELAKVPKQKVWNLYDNPDFLFIDATEDK